MAEFWETSFQDKQMMWGEGPARSALFACDYFLERSIKNILIPGIGYGRNAKPFLEAGIGVTGIEISQTAIDLAKEQMSLEIPIHLGSVADMPFDAALYDGIFCHAVIHLLDEQGRKKLITDSYAQLTSGGSMIFTAISTKAPSYGRGVEIGKNRYEQHGGAQIFFYDESSMREEFQDFGLLEVREVFEPGGGGEIPFLMAICIKEYR